MKRFNRTCVSGLLLSIAAGLMPLSAAEANPEFEELAKKIQTETATVSEDAVMNLLKIAAKEHRALQASVAVDAYLNINSKASLALYLAAARNAIMAGDFQKAASRYSQYFTRAELMKKHLKFRLNISSCWLITSMMVTPLIPI